MKLGRGLCSNIGQSRISSEGASTGKGLTKYRLAQISGVSQTYLYRIERGETGNPRRDTLQRIAAGLSITVAELIGETSPPDAWTLVEISLKAYIPVYAGIYEAGMIPVDYVVCSRTVIPPESVRGYRIAGLCHEPDIREGDTIIVDIALAPMAGDLVLVVAEDGVAIARYTEAENGDTWLDGVEGRYDLAAVTVHGVITEYARKLR